MQGFDSRYQGLNRRQKQAVDLIDGPVTVVAGPGTGKTTVLTVRIGRILRETDTAPENILALTFTETGALTMRRKLIEVIGPAAYKVNIHTFHGFAAHVIERYPDFFPRIIGSTAITEAEQIKLIEHIIRTARFKLLRPYGDPNYYVRLILGEIRIFKRENIPPASLKRSFKKPPRRPQSRPTSAAAQVRLRDAKNKELALVYEKYERELSKQKYYDFDDMLIELIRAMENDRILKLSLQESYQYILCDEHQDSNAAQNRILELLADFHQSPNLFIVGDDKQAIYRFQGASLENFLYFRKKYRGTRVIDLEDNYRSHQGILDAAHSLIEHNPSVPGQSRVRLKSLHAGAKPIRAAEFNKTDDELLYIASAIGRLVERGEKGEEIAVIYRVNREAAGIALVLRAHGISHRIESDHDILGDIDSAKIIILSRAIFDLSDSEYLGRALFLPEMKCDSADVAMLSAAAKRLEKPLHTVIKESRKSAGDLKIKAAYDRLNEWSRQARLVPFPIFLNALIQETDMLAFIAAAADPLDRLDSLQALFEAVTRAAQARKSFYLSDFLEYVDVMKIHGIMAKRNYVEHAGGVRLMTAHGAKGLEFDHVFIVNAVDGVWGNRHRRNHFTIPAIEHARDVGRIEDERRLFYVAMTRARKSLMLCYALSDGKKETLPSQFISEIDPPLVSLLKPVSPDRQRALIRRVESLPKDPAASILDPQFVRSKFLSQPLSVTHLNNFLKCPWRYFFVNLIRVPQAQTKHQMYGTAVHAALRVFFDAYREERYLSKKQLGQIFRHHLEKQAMSVADRAESLEKGKRALEGYYATYVGNWNRQLITEYALKGAFVELDAPATARLELAGKLDKIEFIDGRDAAVVDYKTSRPRSRNEIEGRTRGADGDYKRQLVFYQLLSAVEKRFVMRYGEIDFVEPNERAIYKKERFVITAAEVSQLIETVKKMAAEVVTLSFISAGCGEKDCDHCRLGKILISDQRTE